MTIIFSPRMFEAAAPVPPTASAQAEIVPSMPPPAGGQGQKKPFAVYSFDRHGSFANFLTHPDFAAFKSYVSDAVEGVTRFLAKHGDGKISWDVGQIKRKLLESCPDAETSDIQAAYGRGMEYFHAVAGLLHDDRILPATRREAVRRMADQLVGFPAGFAPAMQENWLRLTAYRGDSQAGRAAQLRLMVRHLVSEFLHANRHYDARLEQRVVSLYVNAVAEKLGMQPIELLELKFTRALLNEELLNSCHSHVLDRLPTRFSNALAKMVHERAKAQSGERQAHAAMQFSIGAKNILHVLGEQGLVTIGEIHTLPRKNMLGPPGNIRLQAENFWLEGDDGKSVELDVKDLFDISAMKISSGMSEPHPILRALVARVLEAAESLQLREVPDEWMDEFMAVPGSRDTRPEEAAWKEQLLLLAVCVGKKAVFHRLMDEQVNLDARSGSRNTPLMLAVAEGAADIVDALAARNRESDGQRVDFNARNNRGRTALIAAIDTGHVELLETLLANGADIDVPDAAGTTPLMHAMRVGNEDTVRFLLDQGAAVNAQDNAGRTPLLMSARSCSVQIFKQLLVLKLRTDIDERDERAISVLTNEEGMGSEEFAALLLKLASPRSDFHRFINARDKWGNSALMAAADAGKEEMVALLLELAPSLVNIPRFDGKTPLIAAAASGRDKVVKQMLDSRLCIDINAKTGQGWTALAAAAYEGHEEAVKLLLAADDPRADVYPERTIIERIPVVVAAGAGQAKTLQLLLDAKLPVNATDAEMASDRDKLEPYARIYADTALEQALEGAAARGANEILGILLKAPLSAGKISPRSKARALAFATEGGHASTVERLLDDADAGAALLIPASDGNTSFQTAIKKQNKEIAELLVKKEATVMNFMNSSGFTVTTLAAYCGNAAEMALLREVDSNCLALRDGMERTPLLAAAAGGQEDMLKYLLKLRPQDINVEDANGKTPLAHAVQSDSVALINILLEAEPPANTRAVDRHGTSALMIACSRGQKAVVGALLEADPEGIKIQDGNGQSALAHAARNGHAEVAGMLLKAGPPDALKTLDTQVQSTLMLGACRDGQMEIVKALLEYEPRLSQAKNSNGLTALAHAAGNDRHELARMLLEADPPAEINAVNSHGVSALMLASHNGHIETVRVLAAREKSANKYLKTSDTGMSALLFASEQGHADVVNVLLREGVNIKDKNKDGMSALHFASANGHLELAKALLAKGANIEDKNNDGMSALLLASANGQPELVKALLARGAKSSVKNNDGKSAVDLVLSKMKTGDEHLEARFKEVLDVLPVTQVLGKRKHRDDERSPGAAKSRRQQ